ncbi:MAG: DNA repair protein RecN [Acidimicrobiales bacterium]
MLTELRVRNLGVIDDLGLVLAPGMTALTGETGAGKTLLVEALELLVGGRADATLVRHGAAGATIEGRFVDEAGNETVITRDIPADGRSRAYVDGRMVSVASLAGEGERLVDLHGQHAHQSLLRLQAQRDSLDHFARTDFSAVTAAEAVVAELSARLNEVGGDVRQLAREADLLRYQVAELEVAELSDPDEEAVLEDEESVLAAADALRAAATSARGLLTAGLGEADGATELLGRAAAALAAHKPLQDLSLRLSSVLSEAADVVEELRKRADGYEADPARLAEVQARRRQLGELRRKYGDTLGDVIAYLAATRARLDDLSSGETRRREIEASLAVARSQLTAAEERVGELRRAAAPLLSAEVAAHLRELAIPRGRLEIVVGEGKGDDVTWLFAANPGEPALPLDRVASGGELARVMLGTRLVLSEAPPTLVFDEVDSGIGGEAALAVGRALHALAAGGHQVLVVTHLAQVAAFADSQVAVTKTVQAGRTVAAAELVEEGDRLVELSRMLSGQPESATGRQHAEELLGLADELRSSPRALPSKEPAGPA